MVRSGCCGISCGKIEGHGHLWVSGLIEKIITLNFILAPGYKSDFICYKNSSAADQELHS